MLTVNNLHNYQRACVKHIIKNPFCGLFMDMGLGKTISTLTAIELLMYDYLEVSSVLVIAPKRVIETVWAEEAAKWVHTRHLTFSKIIGSEKKRIDALKTKADVYLISRDNVAWLCSLYAAKLPFDMLVIDELSSFKSYSSQRFKTLRLARPLMKRVVGLTGTPAPNGLIDLWAQMYLIDRGERLGKTITSYRTNYFRPSVTNGYVVYKYALAKGADEEIQKRIGDICLSMKSEDYLELPELINNIVRVKMNEKLQDEYEKFEKENLLNLIEKNGDETIITATNAGVLSNKLLQFSNGAIYDEDHRFHAVHDLKLEALNEIVEAAGGRPVLVAWTYQSDKERILSYFRSLCPRELKEAQDIKDWNEGKIKMLLAHPASAGHGLNLQTGGNIIVWFGLTWSLELYQQFNARLYRQGQTKAVIIHHIVTENTHDEDVMEALRRKDRIQNALMDSIRFKLNKYLKNIK